MQIDSFERLFEEHAERLFAFLAYRTGNRALAEDLLSETFERVLRARQRFDPRRGSERRWLFSVALNLLRDHARRAKTEEQALQQVASATVSAGGDPLPALEQRDELARALSRLGDGERDALALRYGADLKVRDVARLLGEREDAVEARIRRALAKMRDELA